MQATQTPKHKLLFKLSTFAVILTIVVVVLGAFTRLVDAGLGCPDWPGCYGHILWPNEDHEIVAAEEAFPHAPVELDKTWPEMVHRYFAGSLGLFVLAMFIFAITSKEENIPKKHITGILCLIVLQAAFGMWTVTLKLWPQVVTAHLLGGFSTLSLLWLLMQRLSGWQWPLETWVVLRLKAFMPLLVITLIAVILQIALGGWMSANYAALACPDFPQCLGQWWPHANYSEGFDMFHQMIGPNYLGGGLDGEARTAIHFAHRLGAIVVTSLVLLTGVLLWRLHVSVIRKWVLFLWLVLLVQVLLGISNVVFQLPLAVAVAHNAVGAFLLLTLITIIHRAHKTIKTSL